MLVGSCSGCGGSRRAICCSDYLDPFFVASACRRPRSGCGGHKRRDRRAIRSRIHTQIHAKQANYNSEQISTIVLMQSSRRIRRRGRGSSRHGAHGRTACSNIKQYLNLVCLAACRRPQSGCGGSKRRGGRGSRRGRRRWRAPALSLSGKQPCSKTSLVWCATARGPPCATLSFQCAT